MNPDATGQTSEPDESHARTDGGANIPTPAVKKSTGVRKSTPAPAADITKHSAAVAATGGAAGDTGTPAEKPKAPRGRRKSVPVPTQGELLPDAPLTAPKPKPQPAVVVAGIEPLLEAIKASQPPAMTPAPAIWTVMTFGRSQRPHITWSSELDVAVAQFLRATRVIVSAAPGATFSLAGEDRVCVMMGLCLYQDGVLVAALQQVGAIVVDPTKGAPPPTLACGSFKEAASLILSAVAARTSLGASVDAELAAMAHTKWQEAEEALLGNALDERLDVGPMEEAQAEKLWNGVEKLHTYATFLAPDVWF